MAARTRWIIGSVVTVIGVAMILTGWVLDDRTYLSSLLLQVGSTLLLVVPVLLLERVLEARVRQVEARSDERVEGVREEVREVRRSVGTLQDAFNQRLEAAAHADDSVVENARHDLTFDNAHAALARAAELTAVSALGLRLELDHLWERIRFRLDDRGSAPGILVSIQDARGQEIGATARWGPAEDALSVLAALAEDWKTTGEYPGDSAMNADRIFGAFADVLALVIRARRERGGDQLSPVIEMASPYWALTDFGLEHLTVPPYPVSAHELADKDALSHIRSHMNEKTWIREEDVAAKRDGLDDFWMVTERAHMFFKTLGDAAGGSTQVD